MLKSPKVRIIEGGDQVLGLDDEAEDGEPEEQELNDWTIEHWPVYTCDAQQALKRLKGMETCSHKADPVPLFDQLVCLAPPSEYTRRLPGAIVAIKFTLTYHDISKKNLNTFSADIVCIDIFYSTNAESAMRSASQCPSKS
ncbi:hypothetical protein ONZ45_g19118 [Pleurotus djamor]|nr:hypothetical protein ONZ45_g19607 [Pleurotus djamor]KAJ8454919.1 hypothetical protein ONZ45_g19118 [Pleurotus djamor]